MRPGPKTYDGRAFGRHLKRLRRARKLTQEGLAERSGLSPETIRRLEAGSFSPSMDTLMKLCGGFTLRLSSLVAAWELGELDGAREVQDLLAGRESWELRLAGRVLRAIFERLDEP